MKLSEIYDFLTEGAFKDHRTGGENCYNYMTNNFRFYITLTILPIHFYIFVNSLIRLSTKFKDKKIYYPSVLERIFGILSIIMLIMQAVTKIMSKQLLFSLNPCHLVLQTYVLLNKNTKMNRVIAIFSFNTLFSPIFALLSPHTEGQSDYEIYVYYIEHFLSAFLNPIIMLLCNRYNEDCMCDIESNIISSILLVIYTRSILTCFSVFTKVNVNYTLCPAYDDPVAKIVGKWYYLFSEVYFHLGSILFPRIVYIATKYMILNNLKSKTD